CSPELGVPSKFLHVLRLELPGRPQQRVQLLILWHVAGREELQDGYAEESGQLVEVLEGGPVGGGLPTGNCVGRDAELLGQELLRDPLATCVAGSKLADALRNELK